MDPVKNPTPEDPALAGARNWSLLVRDSAGVTE